jgi:predicted transcriptional regulator
MKTTTIPPLRVSPELRKEAEAVLEDGESLSGFVLDAVTRSIEHRKARQEFIARGLASAEKSRKSGKYVASDRVLGKLERRLAKAKKRAA